MDAVARRFKVLGEPQRLRILQALADGPMTVSELVASLRANQPNVSRHLQALYDAGLVERRRAGTRIVYSVFDPLVFRLCNLVCGSVVDEAREDLREMAGSGLGPTRKPGSRKKNRKESE